MMSAELEPRLLEIISKFRASDAGAKQELSTVFREYPGEHLLVLLEKLKRAERLLVQWDIDAAVEEIRQPAEPAKSPEPTPEKPGPGSKPRRTMNTSSVRNKSASRCLQLETAPFFMRWLRDGRLACVDESFVVHLVDVATMEITARLDRHRRGCVENFDIDRTGTRIVSLENEGPLRLWDETGALLREMKVTEEGAFSCVFIDEWRKVVVTASAQQTSCGVLLYDCRTGEVCDSIDARTPRFVLPLRTLDTDESDVIVIDGDEGILVHSWGSKRVRAYGFPGLYGDRDEDDVETAEFEVTEVAPSRGSYLGMLGANGIATVWNHEVGRTRMTLKGQYESIAITPESGLFFAARGERVEVWDCNERSLLGRISTGAPSLMRAMDDVVLIGVENVLSVWRNSDRKRIGEIRFDAPLASAVCRGRDVVAASHSGEIQALALAGMNLPATDGQSFHSA